MTTAIIESLYNRIWARKSTDPPSEKSLSLREELALQWLRPGEAYLDVGCGTGKLCMNAANRFANVQGCDISETALSAARQKGITCLKIDLNQEPLPYDSSSFDAITALDVIEHLLDPQTFLDDIFRILKPGGQLILSTPNFRKMKNIWTLTTKGHFPKTSGDPEGWDGGHLAYFTRKDLQVLLKKSGFTPSKSIGIHSLDRHQILKKAIIAILGKRLSAEFIAGGILIEAIR
jgi:methionine biosynthesis protein MetW